MDIYTFLERLVQDLESTHMLLSDSIKNYLEAFKAGGCLIQDNAQLIIFLFDCLTPSLTSSDPKAHFQENGTQINQMIQEVCGESVEVDEDLFDLLLEAKKAHTHSNQSKSIPKSTRKMKITPDSRTKDTEVFKDLYMQAINNSEALDDPDMAVSVLDLLNSQRSNEEIQEELLELMGFENIEVVTAMLESRFRICKATNSLSKPDTSDIKVSSMITVKKGKKTKKDESKGKGVKTNYDMLYDLGFSEEFMIRHKEEEKSALQLDMSAPAYQKRVLPQDLQEIKKKFYTEFLLPAPPKAEVPKDNLIPIEALEEWSLGAFKGMTHLNLMQTQVFEAAYFTNDNILVSAPTGAGKTNVALLTVLKVVKNSMNDQGIIDQEFKVVYVAPMKALAAEVTEKFSNKLKHLGLFVRELTGDMQLSRNEMARTHMIVTTPEKWDVVTRKSESIAPQVKLLILDEIHLLDDERGPVIESIVSRTLRQVESSQSTIRILGLSATLPNYKDVSDFLKVPDHACFYFDGGYRPVPLEQRFIGVKKALDSRQQQSMILEACYEKVVEQLKEDHQVMVFVHSRKDTVNTAKGLRDIAVNYGELHWFECCYSLNSKKEVEKSKNRDLKFLFEWGFGIHNAGMLRKDRNLTEKLFREGQIKVLITTATLAWGVNLPAHAVIIKGTEIYDSTIGDFKDVGVLDVQQIFGRAGRPDYDTSGVAEIITLRSKVDKYLQMLVYQRPIESRFLTHLEDALNAEIALGTVSNIQEALRWLRYSYFYVRLRKNPLAYGFSLDDMKTEQLMQEKIRQRVTEAATKLNESRMIRFDTKSGNLATTALGRIASNYYIRCESIEVYNNMLNPILEDEEIYKMFTESQEFKQIKLREDEMPELFHLIEEINQTWIPVKKEEVYTTFGKVISLLYGYLVRHQVEAFSLVSDMAYVVQNGVRILRALFETCLRRFWTYLAERLLSICRTVDRRICDWESPLRQFAASTNMGGFTAYTSSNVFKGGYISEELVIKIETLGLTPTRIKEMQFKELAFLLRFEEGARIAKQYASYLPMLKIEPTIQPITGSIIKIHLEIEPDFTWRERWHGQTLSYWIWVDDGRDILHYEYFLLHNKAMFMEEKPSVTFAVPVHRNRAGDIFYIRCFSDHWVGADTTVPIEIDTSILPSEISQHTELLDLTPLPKTVLQNPLYEALYSFDYFNPIQTQAFHTLFHQDTNVLVGAPTGSGKTITAEIAMFRVFNNFPEKKVIYIAPLKALARERLRDWNRRFKALRKSIVELTGDYTPDIKALNSSDVMITTPEKWDGISRNWQHRGYVQQVALVIIDEIHLLGQERGPVLEVIVSRMRYMATQLKTHIRIIGLSTALANAVDLGNWLGVETMGFFNFKPSVRPVPLQVHIDGFPEKAYCPRMATMNKPAYNAIMTYSANKPTLIFVSSRRQTRMTAFDLIANCTAQQDSSMGFLRIEGQEMEVISQKIKDNNLKQTLMFGIGLHHAGLTEGDRNIVEELFVNGKILVLVTTSTLAWGVNFPAHLVIIKGTEFFDPKLKRYVDFPTTDILQMMGRAGRPQFDNNGIVCIYAQEEKRAFLKTFLYQPFPVESSLISQLHDHINAEVAAGTLTSRGSCINYLTWTYFFRRLTQNPAFYNLFDTSAEGLNEYLIGLVENVLEELQANECITVEEDYVEPTSMGHIASFYYLTYKTAFVLKSQLAKREVSFQELIEVLSKVPEFSELPVRHNEDCMNEELSKLVPYKVDMRSLDSPFTKTHLLLQAHFSRVPLPIVDYLTDTKLVLDQSARIVHGMVDICAEVGTLETTLKIMTLSQMMVQGQWYNDSSLLNVPGLDIQEISKLFYSKHKIEILAQLLETNSKNLRQALEELEILMSQEDKKDFFKSLEQLPLMKVTWTANKEDSEEESLWEDETTFVPGSVVALQVKIQKLNRPSVRPLFNKTGRLQEIGFWLVAGCRNSNKVLALKRFQLPKRTQTEFSLSVEVPEDPLISLYLMNDSYLGLDQQYNIS